MKVNTVNKNFKAVATKQNVTLLTKVICATPNKSIE